MRRDSPPGLLLIDSEPAQAGLISALAQRAGWKVLRAPDIAAATDIIRRSDIRLDVALVDIWSPGEEAVRALAELRGRFAELPIVVVTAQDSLDLAVRAIRAGARDVVIKPIAGARLLSALDNAAAAPEQTGELRPLAEKWATRLDVIEIVGSAPAFRRAVDTAMRAAETTATILIEGESGVGKEALAHAVHRASPQAAGPMIIVNCAALPANLVESELFGHEQNAFAGAFEQRHGMFARADGGTLFLDEIGDLPADAQAKLLRALQSGEIWPIGAIGARRVSVRVIAATNRRLSDDVAKGRFREDLFYRLAVVPVALPPLRERLDDLAALTEHLLGRIGPQLGLAELSIDEAALDLLAGYDWPGNVRQLHNVLFRAAIFSRGARLTVVDFPHVARAQAQEQAKAPANDDVPAPTSLAAHPAHPARSVALFGPDGHVRPMEEIEADLIRLAIGHYRGRMTEVARRLQIGRSTLYRKLGELGIQQAS
jgi:DNA-binding NtrC family response regulator